MVNVNNRIVILDKYEFIITGDNPIARDFEVRYKGEKYDGVIACICNSTIHPLPQATGKIGKTNGD